MRIAIVTDAWFPQVNGVVRTMNTVGSELLQAGHDVAFITPRMFRTFPCPTYPEIRLSINAGRRIGSLIEAFAPDAIHISTEGPLGVAARRWCLRRGLPFTTAFHTRFPEYIHARFRVPVDWSWGVMRWFHGPSKGVMVATQSMRDELHARGIPNTRIWSRGVDLGLFRPRGKDLFDHLKRPVFLYVGRVAVEKNIEAFLRLDLEGTKVVVGDGPQRDNLQGRYPSVLFAGARHGEDLARHFAAANVFVFPSLTDTFGLVLLEAMASGLPVAAFPVPGPIDVVTDPKAGVLDADLAIAAQRALALSGSDARNHALTYSWANCAQMFLDNLHPFSPTGRVAA
ncbi:MAG: glycosyltransferase family 1 protein [Rhodospirillaceae bacterium]